jgi:hypothetical protein
MILIKKIIRKKIIPPLPNPLLHQKHGGEGAVLGMKNSLSSMLLMEERVGERRYHNYLIEIDVTTANKLRTLLSCN